jgi:hypothetical protein
MLLDRQTNPINPKAIKAVRKQIDEIVTMANEYRDFEMYHNVFFSAGPGEDWAAFTIDIEPTTDEDIDTFEFQTKRKPDKKFLNNNSSHFEVSLEKSKNGDFWKFLMTKEQFSNSKLLNELLSWLFEDWEDIDLLFESEDEVDEFEQSFELLMTYRIIGQDQETESSSKSWGKKGAAAAATTTGFVVAYSEEEVTYADDDDSGFDFPEF